MQTTKIYNKRKILKGDNGGERIKTWTEKEVQTLRVNYNKLTNDELQNLFPNKTPLAIYKKAYKLGMRKDKNIEYLNRVNGRKHIYKPQYNKKGYKMIWKPEHHRANKLNGYVMEHIVIWEEAHKMLVPDGYVIHHINENKLDNSISNLQLMKFGEHTAYHNHKRYIERKNKQCQ